jgi:exosortase E/protease (VPEID-CTERM system)
VTFEVVYRLLGRFMPALQVDPENRIIDTGRFAVGIDPVCSGLEGMGLMLAFCIVLLLIFRREFIFPRALLIVPAGLLLSFTLNIARIAGLVLIGDAGYASVAVYGFHSQAGWIAFNAAAVGIALVTLRSSWFNRAAGARNVETAGENPTAVYLMPYMALLLAGMVSRAASGGFERFYWLRLVFTGAALWYSWPRLRGVDWGFSWRGVLAGLTAFVLWITAARLMLTPHGMPAALAALTPSWRSIWILEHVLVTVGILPVVEELAFRGYLLRRVHSAEFESSAPRTAGAAGLLVSTAVFALCQGAFWLPGIMAGIVFGLVYMRTGRLGEAVAAHLTGNALVAATALAGYGWQPW